MMVRRYRKYSSPQKLLKSILSLIIIAAIAFITKFTLADNIYSGTFSANTPYQVCFTPDGNCTKLVVNTIDKAHKSIRMQAYSFTSTSIAKALVRAKKRGIDVKVILDSSQFTQHYTVATYLKNQGIALWDDYQPAIAHNKVIIIDDSILMTGSFNFTKAAQSNNAENLLVIDSPALAELYSENWQKRQETSKAI